MAHIYRIFRNFSKIEKPKYKIIQYCNLFVLLVFSNLFIIESIIEKIFIQLRDTKRKTPIISLN